MALPENHPKRSFIRRAVESEMRLSYHDRILKTLPEAMQNDPSVIASRQPGPEAEYEDPCSSSLSELAVRFNPVCSESPPRAFRVHLKPFAWALTGRRSHRPPRLPQIDIGRRSLSSYTYRFVHSLVSLPIRPLHWVSFLFASSQCYRTVSPALARSYSTRRHRSEA